MNIIATAVEHQRMPSDVWADYVRHPGDLVNLWAFGAWQESKRPKSPAAKATKTYRAVRD